MGKHFLYSTNVYLKLLLQEEFAGDVHYVWCSEEFDAKNAAAYTMKSRVAPSSNPAEIYRTLMTEIRGRDMHGYKISEQRLSLTRRAHEWHATGNISADRRDEMLLMITNASWEDWQPLLYVIPRAHIDPVRIKPVSLSKRASFGPEFIIEDLKRSEFDILEFKS